jgi:tetratricopeptide (TPR) repeat protein
MIKLCKRTTICFYNENFWVLEDAKLRAQIKGISVTEEIISNLKNSYTVKEPKGDSLLEKLKKDYIKGMLIRVIQPSEALAIRNLRYKMEENPKNVEDFFDVGLAHMENGRYKKSVETFKKMIGIYPKEVAAYYCLAISHKNLGQHEYAIYQLKEAIRIKHDFVEAYVNLGMVQVDLENYDQAINALRNAVGLKPKNSKIRFALAICYFLAGDKVAAIEQCIILKSLDENLAKELRKLVNNL